jgi:CII-binding regulator of phage lambda lysogenization HflD
MSDRPQDVSDYVRHVQESTQQYTRDVLKENERLGAMVASLYSEKARLQAVVTALEEQVRRQDVAQTTLIDQVSQMEATSREFTSRYLEVEQLNSNLASLYVASYRIHGSLDREEVLSTLREILINLIGTEEFIVLEREGDELRCATSFGVDPALVLGVRVGSGKLGEMIGRPTPYVAAVDPDATESGKRITACVPLRVGERVVGAIVVYRLLEHKTALEACDLELLNLLATHGATALYCSTLHARHQREPRA